MSAATTREQALGQALETVRTGFGWAYGSYWAVDPADRLLRFVTESGDAGQEFRQVTLQASFAEGVLQTVIGGVLTEQSAVTKAILD